jgi:glutaredoxin 3
MSARSAAFSTGMIIRIYTTQWCALCERAKGLLDARELAYEEIDLTAPAGDVRQTLRALTGGLSAPQVVIDGRPIGGWDELAALDRDGRLTAV